jgi:hypothetical protein
MVEPFASSGDTEAGAGPTGGEDIDVWHRHGHSLSLTAIPSGVPKPFPFRPLAFSRSRRASHVSIGSPTFDALPSGVGHKGAHVRVDRDSGPMLPEDPLAERVLLAKPHSSHTGTLEAEIEPADAGEERSNGQHSSRAAHTPASSAMNHRPHPPAHSNNRRRRLPVPQRHSTHGPWR